VRFHDRLHFIVSLLSPAIWLGLLANIIGNNLPDIDHPIYTFLQVGSSGRFLHPFFLAIGVCLILVGIGLCFSHSSGFTKSRILR